MLKKYFIRETIFMTLKYFKGIVTKISVHVFIVKRG